MVLQSTKINKNTAREVIIELIWSKFRSLTLCLPRLVYTFWQLPAGQTGLKNAFLFNSLATPLREESGVLNAVLQTFPAFFGCLIPAGLRPLWTMRAGIRNLEMFNICESYVALLERRRKSRI